MRKLLAGSEVNMATMTRKQFLAALAAVVTAPFTISNIGSSDVLVQSLLKTQEMQAASVLNCAFSGDVLFYDGHAVRWRRT